MLAVSLGVLLSASGGGVGGLMEVVGTRISGAVTSNFGGVVMLDVTSVFDSSEDSA